MTPPGPAHSQIPSGIPGLDTILKGGLPAHRLYLVEGQHGAGKTTLGLQFCIEGARAGERVLYVTTTETRDETVAIAESHGWSLDGITIHYQDPLLLLGADSEQTIFHASDLELPRVMEALKALIDEVNPDRAVIDSLSELRRLAPDSRWFRRQLLALRQHLARSHCTTLLCDDLPDGDDAGASIAHGLIRLEFFAQPYGRDRRRVRIVKLRGQPSISGFHDFTIQRGGITVFPRLAMDEPSHVSPMELFSSGNDSLDRMFAGGVESGSSVLMLGPAGTGKTVIATRFAIAAAERGETAAVYLFDESAQTFATRSSGLGLDVAKHQSSGRLRVREISPAELSVGEFSNEVRRVVEDLGVRMLVIDSLAGYAYAMLDERNLSLYLHDLLSYLNRRRVTVLLVMTQHGLPGSVPQRSFDVSYIADSVLLFHMFEYGGELRKAISVYKRRGGDHDNMLHELQIGQGGYSIGAPLRHFRSILSGFPDFHGSELATHDDGTGSQT